MNLGQRLLDTFWYVYPTEALTVQAAPIECLKALAAAAKPSQQRLHLRNLFTEGRRYHLQAASGGFRLTITSKIPWRRGRTTKAAVLAGQFNPAGDGATQVVVRAWMRLPYFLDIFFIPSFITSFLVFAPWSGWVILALAAALYGLSWAWHRFTASMQAAEMAYFVRKALEDLAPFQMPALSAPAGDVVDFRQEWNRFFTRRGSPSNGDESSDKRF